LPSLYGVAQRPLLQFQNNARRDNLSGFWDAIYGLNHAVMIVSGFFENVPRHLYEKRELKPDEKPANMVLQFTIRGPRSKFSSPACGITGVAQAHRIFGHSPR
jgi:hypothetical protein